MKRLTHLFFCVPNLLFSTIKRPKRPFFLLFCCSSFLLPSSLLFTTLCLSLSPLFSHSHISSHKLFDDHPPLSFFTHITTAPLHRFLFCIPWLHLIITYPSPLHSPLPTLPLPPSFLLPLFPPPPLLLQQHFLLLFPLQRRHHHRQ